MYTIKSQQIKDLEQSQFAAGTPSLDMMECAGVAAFEELRSAVGGVAEKTAVIFCGVGNNGGDGYVIGRHLIEHGAHVYLCSVGNEKKMTVDTRKMREKYENIGGKIIDINDIPFCDITVDALFGIGFHGELRGDAAIASRLINENTEAFVLAVDIPSGVNADTGEACSDAVEADLTVTFSYPKLGSVLLPGAANCGKIVVRDVGVEIPFESDIEITDDAMVKSVFKPRRSDAHKGDFGHVMVVSGYKRYTGAPSFAANAAVRTGSGLVTLFVPESIAMIESIKVNEAMVYPLPEVEGAISTSSLETLFDFSKKCSACVIGPGLSRETGAQETALEFIKNVDLPMVIDADGINALAGHIDILKTRTSQTILTPHDGELRRLIGYNVPKYGVERVECARKFARDAGCVLLLKGYRTIITDGVRTYINTTGNPGMAKGGSGDVLSGIIGSLLGQGHDALMSAAVGAYVHGLAGDICEEMYGEYGMTPTDMIKILPRTIKYTQE